ncbi:MAG: hypothetical protein IJ618_00165 [Prevotella sp.]|nr:hypothetical protein [Prevotella sp.]
MRLNISPAPTTRRWITIENFSMLSISAMLHIRMNISILPDGHVSIRQCHCAKASKMMFRSPKSPTITIHLIILFD